MKAFLSVLLLSALSASGYDFITSPPLRWPVGSILMDLQLDATMAPRSLIDGHTSWNAVAQEALSSWNQHLAPVQFAVGGAGGRASGDRRNQVFFSSSIYGKKFGSRVLAVTSVWYLRKERIEGDTIFNTAIDWDSYRGDLDLDLDIIDFRRVALHEFGHTLGLDHPDQAKQVNVALMNSIISDLDDLTEDDVRGARALYPPAQRFDLNLSVLGAGTVTTNPMPGLDGKYAPGQVVTLTARPKTRNRFNFWDGDLPATGRKLQVTMAWDRTVVAGFSTNLAPAVTVHPRSQFAREQDAVTLQVRASSGTPMRYQWQHDGLNLDWATNATLPLFLVGHGDSGLYSCQVSNRYGVTSSKPARLVVSGY